MRKYRLTAQREKARCESGSRMLPRGECGGAPTLNVLQCASATCFCHRFAMLSCLKPIGRGRAAEWVGSGQPGRKFVQNPNGLSFKPARQRKRGLNSFIISISALFSLSVQPHSVSLFPESCSSLLRKGWCEMCHGFCDLLILFFFLSFFYCYYKDFYLFLKKREPDSQ